MSRILICGSRDFDDADVIKRKIALLDPHDIVIHGGAPGADTLAGHFAQARGIHTALVSALWQQHGRSAGPRRNRAMLSLDPDQVWAFSSQADLTRGTAHTVKAAQENGIPVRLFFASHVERPAPTTDDIMRDAPFSRIAPAMMTTAATQIVFVDRLREG